MLLEILTVMLIQTLKQNVRLKKFNLYFNIANITNITVSMQQKKIAKKHNLYDTHTHKTIKKNHTQT